MMMEEDIVAGVLISEEAVLSLEEMIHACGTEAQWIVELVEAGILTPQGAELSAWRFGAGDLQRAGKLVRIQRDFGASTDAAAVILDLLDEIERLRAQPRRLGVKMA
jgi:chaperone modulatory protein CbpM